jgi:Protein of unknown function (DUF3040)
MGAPMNDEQVRAAVDEIEQALRVEDPRFVRRVHAVCRNDACTVVTVFLLLAAGAVLLTVGVATVALVPWLLGLASLVTAVAVDDHHKKALRRPR